MALILPNCAFIHIPRTGGTWTRSVIRQGWKEGWMDRPHESGLPEEYGAKAIHHALSNAEEYIGDRFTWSYVRNPLTYLQSRWTTGSLPAIWQMPQSKGRKFYDMSKSKSFEEFLDAYLEICPGWTFKIFSRKLTSSDGTFPGVDYLGKTETVVDDLIHVLTVCGERFDEEKVRAITPKHVSSRKKLNTCKYPPGYKKAIIEAEIKTFEAFGYSTDPDQPLPGEE